MTKLLIRLFIRDPANIQDRTVRTAYGNLACMVGIVCNVLLFAEIGRASCRERV